MENIYHIIKRAIAESIENGYSVLPSFYNKYDTMESDSTNLDFRKDLIKEIPDNIQEHFINYDKFENDNNLQSHEDRLTQSQQGGKLEYEYDIFDVWQIHNKYLLTEINGGLLIVDQHVAHERVLYESAKNKIDTEGLESQTLLFPQYLDFPCFSLLFFL